MSELPEKDISNVGLLFTRRVQYSTVIGNEHCSTHIFRHTKTNKEDGYSQSTAAKYIFVVRADIRYSILDRLPSGHINWAYGSQVMKQGSTHLVPFLTDGSTSDDSVTAIRTAETRSGKGHYAYHPYYFCTFFEN